MSPRKLLIFTSIISIFMFATPVASPMVRRVYDNNRHTYPRQLADVNGDGLDDIVGFGEFSVFVALNNGDGTFGPAQRATIGGGDDFTRRNGGWTDQNTYPRQLADINGDGDADIVGFGKFSVFVALNNGNGTFGPAQRATIGGGDNFTRRNGGWTDQNTYPRPGSNGLCGLIPISEKIATIREE